MYRATVLFTFITAAALAGAPAAGDVNKDILSIVPADAWDALILDDLEAIDRGLASGPAARFMWSGFLDWLKTWLQIVEGLDDRGSAAVLLMPADDSRSWLMRLALVLPATDPEALMTLWSPSPVESGFWKVTLAGRESFLGVKGAFVIIAPTLDTAKGIVSATRTTRETISVAALDILKDAHVSLWVNAAAFMSSAKADMYIPWLLSTFGIDRTAGAALKQVWIGARGEPAGVTLSVLLEPTASSRMALPKAMTQPLLRGLPGGKPVIALGMVTGRSPNNPTWGGRFLPAAFAGMGIIQPDRAAALRGFYATVASRTVRAAVSIEALPGGAAGLVGVTKAVEVNGDPQELLEEIGTRAVELLKGLFADVRINGLLEHIVYRRGAERAGTVRVDHLVADFGETEPPEYIAIKNAFGSEGLLVRLGAVDDRFIVATFGGGLARFMAAVDAVRSGQAPLAELPEITASAGHVATERFFELYVFGDRLAALTEQVSAAIDMPFSLGYAPKPGPPTAVTAHEVGNGAVRWDIFIPVEAMTPAVDGEPESAAGSAKDASPTQGGS